MIVGASRERPAPNTAQPARVGAAAPVAMARTRPAAATAPPARTARTRPSRATTRSPASRPTASASEKAANAPRRASRRRVLGAQVDGAPVVGAALAQEGAEREQPEARGRAARGARAGRPRPGARRGAVARRPRRRASRARIALAGGASSGRLQARAGCAARTPPRPFVQRADVDTAVPRSSRARDSASAIPGLVIEDHLVDRNAAFRGSGGGRARRRDRLRARLRARTRRPRGSSSRRCSTTRRARCCPAITGSPGGGGVAVADLADDTWVRAHDGSGARLVDHVLLGAGLPPPVVLAGRGDEPVEAQALVAAGKGVTIAHALNVVISDRIAVVPLRGAPVRHVQAAVMTGGRRPRCARRSTRCARWLRLADDVGDRPQRLLDVDVGDAGDLDREQGDARRSRG